MLFRLTLVVVVCLISRGQNFIWKNALINFFVLKTLVAEKGQILEILLECVNKVFDSNDKPSFLGSKTKIVFFWVKELNLLL